MKDVIILSKLSLFFTLGFLIQTSLGLVLALITFPNLSKNIEYIYYEYFSRVPFNFFALSLMLGITILVLLVMYLSFFISYKFVDYAFGWKDVKEKFPKIVESD